VAVYIHHGVGSSLVVGFLHNPDDSEVAPPLHLNRSRRHPCAIHFIFCCGALNFIDMPTKEYRILVNGKIVDKTYTSRGHELAVSYYESIGEIFTVEVVDLF